MSVIFSRAPLRISLGGGGTDLPSYYREHGGFLVSGAIDKYVYMLTHTVFQRRYRMKYSEIEEVDEIAAIRHPILRESLLRHWRGNPLEIASVADVPAGTGHGLLRAPTRSRCSRAWPTRAGPRSRQGALAEAACEIEIDVLEEPCGKQDPYVAAHGGICAYTFDARRQRRRRAARAGARDAAGAARSAAAVLHRRGAQRLGGAVRPGRADQDRRRARCSRTCIAPRRSGDAAASCWWQGDLTPTPS